MKRIFIIFLLTCTCFSTYASDLESLSIDNRGSHEEMEQISVERLDISYFMSALANRHWRTQKISSYSFDNSLFAGYALNSQSYFDIKTRVSTYKNFGESASFGDTGGTDLKDLSLKYNLRNILSNNSWGVNFSGNFETTFYLNSNTKQFTNQSAHSQLTLSFSKSLNNITYYIKPYFRNYFLSNSKNFMGEDIDTVKQSFGMMFSQYFNISKDFYLYSGQSLDNFKGFNRDDRQTANLSFGIGGKLKSIVGYYLGINFFNVMECSESHLILNDSFYKYPTYGLDLYFTLF